MKKGHPVWGVLVLTLVLLAFVPQFGYAMLALSLGVMFLVFALGFLAFMAKGLGLLGIEFFFLRWLVRRRS